MSWTYRALPANRHNNQNNPTARGSRKLTAGLQKGRCWVQRVDSNHRHSGYEPDELPDCSTLRYMMPKCHLSRNRVRITDWFIVWLRTCLQPRIGSHFVGRLSKIRTYNVSNVTELQSAAFTVRHTNLNKTYLLAGGREPIEPCDNFELPFPMESLLMFTTILPPSESLPLNEHGYGVADPIWTDEWV